MSSQLTQTCSHRAGHRTAGAQSVLAGYYPGEQPERRPGWRRRQ